MKKLLITFILLVASGALARASSQRLCVDYLIVTRNQTDSEIFAVMRTSIFRAQPLRVTVKNWVTPENLRMLVKARIERIDGMELDELKEIWLAAQEAQDRPALEINKLRHDYEQAQVGRKAGLENRINNAIAYGVEAYLATRPLGATVEVIGLGAFSDHVRGSNPKRVEQIGLSIPTDRVSENYLVVPGENIISVQL